MDKRASWIGGSGSGGDGSDGTPTRDVSRPGSRATIKLAASLRDFFDDFEAAAWRSRGLTGPAGVAARRRLVAALEKTEAMIPNVKALLQAEIIDELRASAVDGNKP